MSEISVRDRIRERREKGVDPEAFLQEVGAIEDIGGEELGFTRDFEKRVKAQLNSLKGSVGVQDIVQLFDIPQEYVEPQREPYPAYKVIHTIHKWPSDAALRFDIATDRALHETTDLWDEVPARQRPRIVHALRSFQDRCYFCDGELVYSDKPVESCCDEYLVITLSCEGCERRFIEFNADPSRPEQVARGE